MPRLLPIDLVNAHFPRAPMGGYRHDEVHELLERAASALEDLTAENDDLRTRILRLQGDLDGMRADERLLKDAIVSAQRAGELLRADATREADLIREEARQQARMERSQAQKEADGLRDEVERLRTMRKRFAAEQRALLEKAMRDLGELEPPAAPSQAVAPPTPEPPVPEFHVQPYPTRLGVTKPLEPVVAEPVIVEDETGEKWVS